MVIGIMDLNPKRQVEVFHLLFLQQFSMQIAANLYAIKGGCNLRFFFHSARYSEDLDIDIKTIQKQTLENKVNKVLESAAFQKLLHAYGISRIQFSTSKQTMTTQRWKIQLFTRYSEMPMHTKIEFSRRQEDVHGQLENINLEVCQRYRLSPIRLSHYALKEAVLQKVLALAHRSLTQARDVFDLYHLLHLDTPPKLVFNREVLQQAEKALVSLRFQDYASQVIVFLEPEKQNFFGTLDYWQVMCQAVGQYLQGS